MIPFGEVENIELSYRRYARLLGMADAVSLRHNPDVLFKNLTPRLKSIIPFDLIDFALADPPSQSMKMYTWKGEAWPDEPTVAGVDEAAVGWAWKNHSVLSIPDVLEENRFQSGLLSLQKQGIRSYCVLPLSVPGENLGAIGFGSKRPGAFSDHDSLFLNRVAELVALCMGESLAQAALSLAPLVSNILARSLSLFNASNAEGDILSSRDYELLRQIAATLVPLVERAGPVEQVAGNKAPGGYDLESFTGVSGEDLKIWTGRELTETSFRSLVESLHWEKRRGQVLAEVARLLGESSDIKKAFPRISAYLRRLLYQEYAELSLCDSVSGKLVNRSLDFPLQRAPRADTEPHFTEDLGERALQSGSPVILNKEEMKESRAGNTKYFLSEGLQSLCCIPLVRSGDPLGVIVLGSTRSTAFRQEDMGILHQVAAQLAVALENENASRELENLKNRLDQERQNLEGDVKRLFPGIIGDSEALRKSLDRLAIVAESDASVLILGETGTGKGLVARALQETSLRKSKPFVTLNCAAIPTGLLESELFGHEKGAFTGAVQQKIGRVELADHGTLFLDEIGEISTELQPKLLRFLQDQEFERLGGVKTIKVNLRVVAATNRNLIESVARKEFRSDLFYRLNVFPIRLPSLRERREDIPLLVRYFVRKYSARMSRIIESIPTETMDAMVSSLWPGNVRELENFIERSVILTQGTQLQAPLNELQHDNSPTSSNSLQASEREQIIQALRESNGLISGNAGAAQRLGVPRSTLQSKIAKFCITSADYLP